MIWNDINRSHDSTRPRIPGVQRETTFNRKSLLSIWWLNIFDCKDWESDTPLEYVIEDQVERLAQLAPEEFDVDDAAEPRSNIDFNRFRYQWYP